MPILTEISIVGEREVLAFRCGVVRAIAFKTTPRTRVGSISSVMETIRRLDRRARCSAGDEAKRAVVPITVT
jgi:hypothetical protein